MAREPDGLIVSASGIRGVVGPGLDPGVAARYGGAFGSRVARGSSGRPLTLLARDSRVSGPLLADAVAAGLRAAGCAVRDLGVAATPTALLAVQDDGRAEGGVIVTASHNPVQWNGLKLASAGGEFVSPEEGRAVQEAYESGPRWAAWDDLGGREDGGGAVDHHVARILALDVLDPEAVAARGFRVALDTVRGAAGPVMSRLLERLGCRVEGRDLEPDGIFPRDPEPRPENLDGLGELVRATGSDLGMAVDPDGDRLALVDGDGEPVGEDHTLALAAAHVLALRPGPAVTNLSSSRAIADVVERAGGEIHLAPVGEANVARRMREVDAVIGGEGNGGVMLPSLHLTRDAPVAAALVLACLARRGSTLREAVDELPGYAISKRRAPRPEGDLEDVYRALAAAAGDDARRDRQDGLRLDWPDERKWLHVRPSGTEPIVRVIAEAPSAEEAGRLTARALERIGPAEGPGGEDDKGD
ncbi:MAG: phosphoglucosamine mutase [Gemmatimonadota bacterium]